MTPKTKIYLYKVAVNLFYLRFYEINPEHIQLKELIITNKINRVLV